MLSTGRLVRATKLLCDFKVIEGTNRCRFHVYAVNSLRQNLVRRKQLPVAYGVVNFASTDASEAAKIGPQVLAKSSDDLKILTELGIIPPYQEGAATSEDVNQSPGAATEQYDKDPVEAEMSAVAADPVYVLEMSPSEVTFEALNSEILLPENTPEMPFQQPEAPEEVFREPNIFETSILPEVHASPLDESYEPSLSGNTVSPIEAEAVSEATPAAADIATTLSDKIEGIPELSTISPDATAAIVENVGRIASEPAFSSIGLGGWSPVGLVQYALEYFHVGLDLPWWGAIALGTLIIRVAIFPLVIVAQRNAAKMNNYMPQMQALQLKMSDARQRGDRLDAARYTQELAEFMKDKGLNPLKNMIVPLCQAPFFISMFMGIRGMANLPVDSFRSGGLWWFTDLTVPDQFYLLPLITSATLALTIEVGTDMAKLNSGNMGMTKYVLRAMPLLVFPFTLNFPAGVLVYWCSANFISLFQVAFLKIPAVRDYFKIDPLLKFDKKALPIKDKGFVGGMKDSWTNMKITRELEERERLDNANFLRAGRGAIKKTYKFDPTQPLPPRNLSSIQLKKRD